MAEARTPPKPRGKRLPMGLALRGYLLLTRLLAPIAPALLRKRLRKGREDPTRLPEKLGQPSAPRPEGERLVWMHAVGLGEVLALRALIAEMSAIAPDLHYLVTTTARSSAAVFAANLPENTIHQFLPLDAPRFFRPFLAHWRPDLSIWAEQDLWPGLVTATQNRAIPLALVNARMNAASYAKRARALGLYRDLLARFALISAQDPITAENLRALGAKAPVQIHPSFKLIAPALSADTATLAALRTALAGRKVWLHGPSHAEGEAVALKAQKLLLTEDPQALLILAPRQPDRGPEIVDAAEAMGLTASLRSQNPLPEAGCQTYIANSFGEMGLWYRLASHALIGGSFGPTEGHNPWEAARLGAAILHGPRTGNFSCDYGRLTQARAAMLCASPEEVAQALLLDLGPQAARAAACCAENAAGIRDLARDLVDLLPGTGA